MTTILYTINRENETYVYIDDSNDVGNLEDWIKKDKFFDLDSAECHEIPFEFKQARRILSRYRPVSISTSGTISTSKGTRIHYNFPKELRHTIYQIKLALARK